MEKIIIRNGTEEDRIGISIVLAEAFFEDWKRLSTDVNKVSRALSSGITLENYIVAIINDEIVGFLAYVTGERRAFYANIKDFQKEFGYFKGYMGAMIVKNDLEKSLNMQSREVFRSLFI